MELDPRFCLLGFFFGVAIHSLVSTPLWLGILGLLISGCVTLVIRGGRMRWSGRVVRMTALLFIGVSLGVIRYDLALIRSPKGELDQYLGHSIQFTGTVIQLPEERGQVWRTLFHPDGARANISVSVPLYPPVKYGDRLQLSGTLVKPEAFLSESGRIFNYPEYLALSGTYYQLKSVKATRIEHGNGNWVKEKLFNIRETFLRRINTRFAEPESALLAGLLIGEKSSLGKALEEAFRKAGVIHIVVLSGFNITIIGQAVMYVLSGLPRRIGIVSGIGFVVLFSVMTGATATVMRSTIMAVIALIATFFYRTYNAQRALFLAAFLMVLFEPRTLMFDPSFQLSFLSTIGLMYLSPMIERRLMWCSKILRAILVATLSTQLFVLPYLLFTMGDISLVSVFTNLAILPAIPLTMLFGFVATMSPFPFSILPTSIAHAFLAYIFMVVRFFSDLPLSTVSVPYFPGWLVILWYGITGGFLWKKYGRQHETD